MMTRFNTKTLALLSALALSAGFAQATHAGQLNGTNANPQISSKSITNGGQSSNGGQWQTLSNGCSYSRAQAPGYAPTWHLIVNPQMMGLPTPTHRCKGRIQG